MQDLGKLKIERISHARHHFPYSDLISGSGELLTDKSNREVIVFRDKRGRNDPEDWKILKSQTLEGQKMLFSPLGCRL